MDQLSAIAAVFPNMYASLSSQHNLGMLSSLSMLRQPYLHPLLSRAADNRILSGGIHSAIELQSRAVYTNPVKVTLDEKELWQSFHMHGTEMIVTRSGRRMFPTLKVKLEGLDPHKKYYVMLDIIPMDDARYKFCNGRWGISGRAEPQLRPMRPFVHPDSPSLGKHWMEEGLVSFNRVKLTNNSKDHNGNMLLNSMHRYQPRVLIIEGDDLFSLKWQSAQSFVFPETSFFAVTAYQNEKITHLKIENNPFAKGFRHREKPFSQKRSAPFIDQLKEAASSQEKRKRCESTDSENEDDEQDNERSPSHSLESSCNRDNLELLQHDLMQRQREKLANNFMFPLAMNRLPIMNLPYHQFLHNNAFL